MSVNNSSDYDYTDEQNAIIDTITTGTEPLLVIEAVAGAAKSSTIVEAVKRRYAINPRLKAEYTVFGSSNAEEARTEFGHSCQASTIHSKAYQAIVKPYGMKLPIASFMSWRDIPKSLNIPFNLTSEAIQCVADFCVSSAMDLDSYNKSLEYPMTKAMYFVVDKLLEAVFDGKIRCTHSAYLKLYHILVMNGTIKLPELDILIADEAGDMTQISLDIFHKSPARQKVIIGDSGQSVFGFMNLVSAFDFYREEGIHLELSKSFRVNKEDAVLVEAFCRDTFSPDMSFKGMDYPEDKPIVTSAFITRTNSTLISKMIQLDAQGTPFRLSSKAKVSQMFLWPLALIYLKPGYTQHNKELSHLQADADNWGRSPALQQKYSLRQYILHHNEYNQAIQNANRLLMQYSPEEVITAKDAADGHVHSNAPLTLLTAHTSKGLTFDSVTLADDLNLSVTKALLARVDEQTQDDIETFKLYYIACSRHRLRLLNASHLQDYKEFECV